MWQYRAVVIACVAVVIAAAAAYGVTRPRTYSATSTLIAEAPLQSAAAASDTLQGRFITDQLAVLQSPDVARRAAQLLAATPYHWGVSEATVRSSAHVTAIPGGDAITVRFTAPRASLAEAGAITLPRAYQDIARSLAAANANDSVARINGAIASIDQSLASVQPPSPTTNSEASQTLEQERTKLLDQRAQLVAEREKAYATAATAGTNLSTLPPQSATVVFGGTAMARLLGEALVIGLLLGAGLSYVLAIRRRVVTTPSEFAHILDAPLLVEVPDYSRAASSSSRLPILADPESRVAEAFRFGASAIASRAVLARVRTVLIVSPAAGDGRTTVVANMGIAAALDGMRVLLIDAHPRSSMSNLLQGIAWSATPSNKHLSSRRSPGATDFGSAVRSIPIATATAVDLLSVAAATAPDIRYIRSENAYAFFLAAKEAYDLVLIDTAPLLTSSSAAAFAAHADAGVVVVRQKGSLAELHELDSRMQLLGLNALGYVYNRRPRKDRRARSEEGSPEVAVTGTLEASTVRLSDVQPNGGSGAVAGLQPQR